MAQGQRIVVVGGGGHARVIIDAAQLAGHQVVGVLDRDASPGSMVLGRPVLGRDDEAARVLGSLAGRVDGVVVAIGDNATRGSVVRRLEQAVPGLGFATVIHPAAVIAPSARIGAGTVVLAAAVVGVDASVGKHCIVNTAASVDHDNLIEDFSSIAPGAVLGGTVRVGTYTAVCLGAKVIHGMTIGSHAVVGAGATVVKNVADNVVVMGTPARVVRATGADRRD